MTYYHGGVAGLRVGDTITPGVDGNRRHNPRCPICVARNTGAHAPLDPAPQHDGVYITTDREYGRHYASLADGDLYVVTPEGPLVASTEDRFPTWIAPTARVTAVYDRAVRLTGAQRRRLLARWIDADAAAEGHQPQTSLADRRRTVDRQYLWMLGEAHRIARQARNR